MWRIVLYPEAHMQASQFLLKRRCMIPARQQRSSELKSDDNFMNENGMPYSIRDQAKIISSKLEILERLAAEIREDFVRFSVDVVEPIPVTPPIAKESVVRVAATLPADIPVAAWLEAKPKVDLEQLIAGKGLFVAGLALVALAAAFFLKIAFDTWIGPEGRVLVGIVIGVATALGGIRYCRGSLQRLGDGLIALGCVIELLTIYAATLLFRLVEPSLGLFSMDMVVLLMTLLALKRRSELLAMCGGLGGLATCMLLGSPSRQGFMETAYIATINVALLNVARAMTWRNLRSLVVIGTVVALAYIASIHPANNPIVMALVYLAFYVGCIVSAIAQRSERTFERRFESVAATLGFAAIISGLFGDLYSMHRGLLTLALFLVAGIHVLRAMVDRTWQQMRYAVSAAAIAVAVPFDADFRDVSVCFDTAVLYALGCSQRDWLFRAAGCLLILSTSIFVFNDAQIVAPTNPIFNVHFFFSCAWSAAAIFIGYLMRKTPLVSDAERQVLQPILPIAGHLGLLNTIALEAWLTAQRYAGGLPGLDQFAVPQVVLSLTWIIFAAVFMIIGFMRRSALMRWESLIVIGVVLYKLLVVDLSSLALSYRVVSALVVGVIALIVAGKYQRVQFFRKEAAATESRGEEEPSSK